jgi:methylenetetrahydrofolate reductase (NADPH)
MTATSRLERVLNSGRFAVTAELNPPDSADPESVYERAIVLAEVCDGINATDASGAHVHMSSVGVCALLTRAGYEPVMQVSCRDRNRIAVQGDLLGAAAMGVRNVLCLTGDGVETGDHPDAKPVFDLDSVTLLKTARSMCEQSRFMSGRELDVPPRFFLGAAANPFVPPLEFRPHRLAKKVRAGADFIQTQFCFDVPLLQQFMQAVRDLGLAEKVFILAGVGPIRSARAGDWMRTNVPGVHIPDAVIARLNGVPTDRQAAEGKRLCVEIIQQVREIPGVSGVHVMAYRQEETVAEIIHEAGLLPRAGRGRRGREQTRRVVATSFHTR